MGRCDEVVVTIRRERPSGPPLPRVFSSVSKSREGLSREPPIYPEDGAVGGPPVPKQRLIYGDGKVFFLKESMRIRIMKDEVGGGAAAAPMSPDADPAESMTLFNPGHVLCVKTRYYAFVFPSLIWSRIKRGGGGVGGGGCCARASERAVVGFFFLLSQTLSLSLSLSHSPQFCMPAPPSPRRARLRLGASSAPRGLLLLFLSSHNRAGAPRLASDDAPGHARPELDLLADLLRRQALVGLLRRGARGRVLGPAVGDEGPDGRGHGLRDLTAVALGDLGKRREERKK